VKLNVKPFFIGRIFHGVFSAIAAYFLLNSLHIQSVQKTMGAVTAVFAPFNIPNHPLSLATLQWGSVLTLCTLITFVLYNGILKSKDY
jgi:hypothetical protein